MALSKTVAQAWTRLIVAKKPSEQLSQFRQEVEGKKFRNPDTDNEVLFVSLPKTEQARIFSEWRRRQRGDEPKRERERGLIEVDKKDAREQAKHIAEVASGWLVRDEDEPIGDRFTPGMGRDYITVGTLKIKDVRGREFERPLRLGVGKSNEELWRAGRHFVTGGRVESRHVGEDDPGTPMFVRVDLNPKISYGAARRAAKRIEQEVYSVLIHEMTHARDVLETPRQQKRHKEKHRVPEDTPPSLRTEAENRKYYNKPTEVRAFKQQVADEVRRELEKRHKVQDFKRDLAEKKREQGEDVEFDDDADWIEMDAEAVMGLLEKSVTWDRVRKYLSGPNRRKFLESVASVVRKFKEDRGGKVARRVAAAWLHKVAQEAATFDEWVADRRFRNPATGNDVLFKSLSETEQAKIRARWKGPKKGEAEPGKVKAPLFHTTSHAALEQIAEHGLTPRQGSGTFSHGGYGEHSQGKVFLSDNPQAARAWQDKVFQQLEDRHGDENDEGVGRRVPVMLRVKSRRTRRDEVGDKDVPGSRYVNKAVPPEDIEFWHPDKKQWAPLSEWEDASADLAVDRDGGTYVNDSAFMPASEDAYDRDDASAAQSEKERRDSELAEQRSRNTERERKEREEREQQYLEPAKRREWIEKIKAEGAKAPIPSLTTPPGVFPTMWQHRLKVDEKGNPLPEHPLKSAVLDAGSWRVASAWLRVAISKKHVDKLLRRFDTDDLPFDHLFEGKRRMVVDPEEYGGLGVGEPDSAKDLEKFLQETGALAEGERVDWKAGYVVDGKGKVKSKIGKAIQKGVKKFVGDDLELHSAMAQVRKGLAKAETPIQRTLGMGRDNLRALTGMGHLLDKEFPTAKVWKELEEYGVPSPESWKQIKGISDKFAALTPDERREMMDAHEQEYNSMHTVTPARSHRERPDFQPPPEDYRRQYWDARGLFQTHNKAKRGDEADWLMKHFKGWVDRTDDFYESKESEPVRKLHELGPKLSPERLEEMRGLTDIEKKQQEYDLWRSIRGDELSVVLSRDPVDVLRMSDHPKAVQAIQSCHSEGGSEFQCALEEAEEGGMIAYVVKKSDIDGRDLEKGELFEDQSRDVKGIKPFARLRLRRFENDHADGGLEIAIPEMTSYGAAFPDLVQAVTNWARETQPELVAADSGYSKRPRDWRLTGGTYQDNESSELFDNFFNRGDGDDLQGEPTEDQYDPYGEGYTIDDSPYYDPDQEDEDEGESEVTEKSVEPWRGADSRAAFWDWMQENHPKVPNPNRRGTKKEISPSTLKGYARGRAGYSAQARETVGRYMARYQDERKDYAEARARGDIRAARVARAWLIRTGMPRRQGTLR